MIDGIDFRLIARLVRTPHASYESVGRDLALSGPAVRYRLNRLNKLGVLRGVAVLPTAAILGRYHVICEYPAEDPTNAIREILDLDVWPGSFSGTIAPGRSTSSPTFRPPDPLRDSIVS